MKFCCYQKGDGTAVGIVTDRGILDLGAFREMPELHDLQDVIAAGMLSTTGLSALAKNLTSYQGGSFVPLDRIRLRAPLARPGKIVGIGRNYAAHAAEVGAATGAVPKLFFKMATSVIGPGDPVSLPAGVEKLDYEVELAVIIGKTGKLVSEKDALDYVAGYTIVNDLSAREFQFEKGAPMTSLAKSMDGFCPMGPYLVTPDEIPDVDQLRLRCWINDELRQDAYASELVFRIPVLISYISQYMTLEPGDLISTGTPAGVAMSRNPSPWLKKGDWMRLEISGLGVLVNQVV